jgi:hypothetical protein
LIAAAIGVLTIGGAYLALAFYKGPFPSSDLGIIAELLSPIAAGLLMAVLAYRALDSLT